MSGTCDGAASSNLFCDATNQNEWWRLDTTSVLIRQALVDPFGAAGIFAGFRVATRDEVIELWNSAGFVDFPGGSSATNRAVLVDVWADAVGWTCGGVGIAPGSGVAAPNGCVSSNGFAQSSGIFEIGPRYNTAVMFANGQSTLPNTPVGNSLTIDDILAGTFSTPSGLYLLRGTSPLVVPVAEASTLMLLLSAVTFIIARRRHRGVLKLT